MKKIVFLISLFIININIVSANEKIEVKFSKCVDGDTAHFILNNEEIKTRFLAIDTPESTKDIEEYGIEASNYTCKKLKNANIIEIEYDKNSDKLDKYDRHLVWVFVDGHLLQDEIVKEGLAEVAYLYNDYKYTNILKKSEEIAKNNKINIWSNYQKQKTIFDNKYILFILIIIIILVISINKNLRDKIIKEIKDNIKNKLKQIKKRIVKNTKN